MLPGSASSTARGVGLDDRQRIHIGANGDRRAIARAQIADHAGLADAGAHVDAADLAQGIGHHRSGAHFLEGQLGVLVDIAAETNELIRERLGFLKHIVSLFMTR